MLARKGQWRANDYSECGVWFDFLHTRQMTRNEISINGLRLCWFYKIGVDRDLNWSWEQNDNVLLEQLQHTIAAAWRMLNESDGWHDVTFECRQKTKYRYLHVKLCIRLNEFLYRNKWFIYKVHTKYIHGTAQIRQQKSMAILLLWFFRITSEFDGISLYGHFDQWPLLRTIYLAYFSHDFHVVTHFLLLFFSLLCSLYFNISKYA